MKILVLGDLHHRREWFAWVAEQAPAFDLVALTGDLLDFFQGHRQEQKDFVLGWFAEEAAKGRPLAWCSGNHDVTRNDFAWIDGLRFPSVVGDLETKFFTTASGEPFLVSSIPYQDRPMEAGEREVDELLTEGWKRRSEMGWCPWIVLAHNPPIHTLVARAPGDVCGSPKVRAWIEQFQPDYLLSGHLHQSPDLGSHQAELGQCQCINAGCVAKAVIPSHVVIDTVTKEIVFRRGA